MSENQTQSNPIGGLSLIDFGISNTESCASLISDPIKQIKFNPSGKSLHTKRAHRKQVFPRPFLLIIILTTKINCPQQ